MEVPQLEVWCGSFKKELKGEDQLHLYDATIAGDQVFFTLLADGHGGKEAACIAAQRLLPTLTELAKDGSAEELHKAAVQTFRALHEEICKSGTTSGSTVTVCSINATRHELAVWNVGDSLAVLVDGDGHAPLGTSHRLEDNKDEQARVTALGARLGRALTKEQKTAGPVRAWPGGLAVTRTLGDADCRDFVIPEPSWSMCPLPPNGGALLACTDGVWDHLSFGEGATVLLDGRYDSAGSAAKQVVRKAARRGVTDDITAVVMLFGPAPTSATPTDVDNQYESMEAHSFLRRVSKTPPLDEGGEGGEGDESPIMHSGRSPSPNETPLPSHERHEHPSDADDSSGSHSKSGVLVDESGGSVKPMRRTEGRPVDVAVDEREADVHAPAPRRAPNKMSIEVPSWDAAAEATPSTERVNSSKALCSSSSGSSPHSPSSISPALQMQPALQTQRSRGARLSMIFDSFVSFDSSKSLVRTNSIARRMRNSSVEKEERASPPWSGKHSASPVSSRNRSSSDQSGRFSLRTSDAAIDAMPSPASSPNNSVHGGTHFANCWRGITADGDPKPGTRVADWSQLGPFSYLGEGEFATAHQTSLDGKSVAIKLLKPSKQEDPSAVQGLKREIMLMTLMDFPYVLKAHALGQHEGKPLMIIELLGCTLTSQLPRDPDTVPFWVRWREVKRWPLSRALHCARQLAQALKYCHDDAFPGYRILHRDVKPNNIGFLANEASHLVLFDFGLASLWEKKGDANDDVPRALTGETGSLRYMAPEVATSKPYGPRAEVFSFATVTYELASHKRPFVGFSPDVFKSAIAKGFTPPLPPKWPADLTALFRACWSLDPAQRPEFHQLLPQLDALCDQHPFDPTTIPLHMRKRAKSKSPPPR